MIKSIFHAAILTSLLCTFMAPMAMAQTTNVTVRDFESWSSAKLNLELTENLELSLNEQLRLKNNSSTIDQYFTQFSAKYGFKGGMSMALAARFIRDNDDQGKIQGYENHFRWQSDLGYKHGIKRFVMRYRLRYQNKNEWSIADEPNTKLRFKAASTYNIRNWKLDPSLSAEVFSSLSRAEYFNLIRLTTGTKYKSPYGDFGLYYSLEQDLIGLYPKTTHIARIKYEYTIKRKN